MARNLSSWQGLVRERGYTTERDMLEDLYERSGLSIREIEVVIKKPYSTIKHRIEMHGIPFRGRGGANRKEGQ